MRAPLCAALLAIAAAGCAPRHSITATHGRSTRAAFDRQVANRDGAEQPPRGLDSQEAAIVAHTFRDGLAPKGEARDAPVLLVAPPAQGAGAQRPLQPSVPVQR